MGIDQWVNIFTGVIGTIIGALVAYIAMKKMPAEIGNQESQTMQNILASNKMLSDDNRQLHKEIEELRAWFTGTIEISTKLELSNPPRVIEATVKRIPVSPSSSAD